MSNLRGRAAAEAIARRYTEKREHVSSVSHPVEVDEPTPDWRNRARAETLARRYAKINRKARRGRTKDDGLDEKVGGLDEQYEGLDEQVDAQFAGRDDQAGEQVGGLDEQFHGLDEKVGGLDEKVDEQVGGFDHDDEIGHLNPPNWDAASEFTGERNETSRGKAPVDHGEDMEMGARFNKTKSRKSEPELTITEMRAIFLARGFTGTRYPHPSTMEKLGISGDVSCLFELCGLTNFMKCNLAAYQVETCHFLASLKVHFYEENPDYVSDGGVGWITFKVRGKKYSITTNELDNLYGFSSGTGTQQEFEKGELQSLWQTIGTEMPYSSSRSKGSQIRHPAVRYLHKAIASTMFARRVTGTVNEGELQVMDLGLKGILEFARDGRELVGDKANTSLTLVLLAQFQNYREWAVKMHRKNSKGELCIGGVITPILIACHVPLISEPTAPKWLDVEHLTKAKFLDRTTDVDVYLYQFIHPTAGPAQLQLPCLAIQENSLDSTIDFSPPLELLQPAQEGDGLDQTDRVSQSSPPDYTAPATFHFEEFTTSKRNKSLWEAHKRIGLLQKWNKVQDKTIKALKSTVKDMSDGWKEMKELLNKFQSKGKSNSPGKDEPGQPSVLRKSGSMNTSSKRNKPLDPPRASSFEPRQRKKHAAGSSRAGSSMRLDHHVKPSHQPYSRESMEESIDSYFSNH